MNPRDVPTVPDATEEDAADLPSKLGHFEIVGRLGAGGMGMVFEGRDAVLGRRVALKLLHPERGGSHVAPARLLREAQALAKLSHPNVVMVFEVGMAGNDPFVAMELVEGNTLLEWMREPHDWRAVLDVFIAVGHGLAAVHALGLVHRDFKPSNVLFDARGVPKLGDFGLVGTVEDHSDEAKAAPISSSATTLTETGSVMGTPAYMAPEQRLGSADARADQYSFAKTLREALREPIRATLEPILARAMATEPADRYPAMEPLLAALARVRRGNRRRWIVAGSGVAAIAAVALAWGFGRAQSADDPCPRPTGRLAKVWNPERRDALATHMKTIDPTLGAQRFTAATGVLDRGAERWMDQHVDACEFAHAGRQSDALLDRRMTCLDRALLEIDDTVAVLEHSTDRTTLDDAMRAAVGLPALDDCADVNALTELLPRPTNPVHRAEADALSRESVDIDVSLRTGGTKSTHVADRAKTAVTRARTLGDPETLARALRSLAGIQTELESGEVVLTTLREAITAASSAHDDRMVADLWSKLLTALAQQDKVADAKTLLPAAEAAFARTKSTTELRVTFLQSKAQVEAANGDVALAQESLAEAIKSLDAAAATAPGSPLRPLLITIKSRVAVTHGKAGEWPAMVNGMREIVPLANLQYGADHPVVMQMHFNLGVALRRTGDDASALVEFREAARIGEARLSPSPSLADYIFAVGSTLVALRKQDEAILHLDRAVTMARTTLPPGDPRLANSVGALAAAYIDLGRFDNARPLLDENVAILEKRGTPDEKLAIAYFNRGNWAVQTGHCELGWPDFDRALAIYKDLAMTSEMYEVLYSTAECQLKTEQWAAAVKTTEVILAAKDASPEQRVLAKFDHGRGLVALGQRSTGLAEVRAARDEMMKLEMVTPGVVPLVNNWLTKYGGKVPVAP